MTCFSLRKVCHIQYMFRAKPFIIRTWTQYSRWKRSRLNFFWIKTASFSLIVFQRAELSTRSITNICWCNWRTFWRNSANGKVTNVVLFLYDNAPAHRTLTTLKKPAYMGFQCLRHPPCSPELAPSDYHVFPGLKKKLKGRHFSSEAEVVVPAETWLDGRLSDFFWVACRS